MEQCHEKKSTSAVSGPCDASVSDLDSASPEELSEEVHTGPLDALPLLDASALAPGILKRIVFGPGRFWQDWVMRYFVLPPGQKVPSHAHDWDHLAVALQGDGRLVVNGEAHQFSQGHWGHVPAGASHAFENAGNEPFAFLCIVPTSGDPHAKRAQHRLARKNRGAAEDPSEA